MNRYIINNNTKRLNSTEIFECLLGFDFSKMEKKYDVYICAKHNALVCIKENPKSYTIHVNNLISE
jgi:hypothetical protein